MSNKLDPELLASQNAIIANQEAIQAKINQVLTNQEQYQIQQEMIGIGPNFQAALKQAQSVAQADTVVLLRGETGTGKELLAHHIHARSDRSHLPMMTVNCAALPASLVETELFGYERGAFTGAFQRKAGKFEVASGGTIFLDEIGDVPLEAQAKFLRVLQDGVFERVGGTRHLQADVRLIAATNQPLEQLIAERKFRADLFYRLNVFPITLPPLRERPDDILPLVNFFAAKYGSRFQKTFSKISRESLDQLHAYEWPGNIRELQHLVERAVLISEGEVLEISLPEYSAPVHLPGHSTPNPPPAPATPAPAPKETPAEFMSLRENERTHIESVLRHTHGRISGTKGAARILDVNPSTLRSRMKKLGISAFFLIS
jgi:transcriptional regulator with GAF, ATPase, and Fis domain